MTTLLSQGLFSYQTWNGMDGFWQNGVVLETMANAMHYLNFTRFVKQCLYIKIPRTKHGIKPRYWYRSITSIGKMWTVNWKERSMMMSLFELTSDGSNLTGKEEWLNWSQVQLQCLWIPAKCWPAASCLWTTTILWWHGLVWARICQVFLNCQQ